MTGEPDERDLRAVEERLDEGDAEGAVRLLRKLAGPDLGAAPMPLPALAAEALLLGDDPAAAERVVLAALARAPADPDLIVWKAAAEYRLWKFREASESARLALAAEPDLAYAHQVRGLACDHLGRRDEAAAHLASEGGAALAEPEIPSDHSASRSPVPRTSRSACAATPPSAPTKPTAWTTRACCVSYG